LNALIQDPVTSHFLSSNNGESPYIQAMKDDQTSITQEFSETVLGYNLFSFIMVLRISKQRAGL